MNKKLLLSAVLAVAAYIAYKKLKSTQTTQVNSLDTYVPGVSTTQMSEYVV